MTEPAFFCNDPTGRRCDAGLHAELLSNSELDDQIARQTIAKAVESGAMSLADAVDLYGTDSIRQAFITEGIDPREPKSPPTSQDS
ncbi:MAG: hypothetical protein U1A77_08935 [Pirellulales bacterium]